MYSELKTKLQQSLNGCKLKINELDDEITKLNEYKLKLEGGIEAIDVLEKQAQQTKPENEDTRIPLVE